MQNMAWKENTKPHLSENIGSEQRGERPVRVRDAERRGGWGPGTFGRGEAMTGRLDVSTALAPALAQSREGQGQACGILYIRGGLPSLWPRRSPGAGLKQKRAVEQRGCAWGPVVPVDTYLLLQKGVHWQGTGCGCCRD